MSWGTSFQPVIKQETLATNNTPQRQVERHNQVPTHDASCASYSAPGKTVIQSNCDCSLSKVRSNLSPTHDPYTNPNAQIYYSCGCGAIFDPGTKRFAELNNRASEAGWKVRFSDTGYVPYCMKCGEGVE